MRMNIQDRFYRTFTRQRVDRVPDIEFGYWPQTIRRWLKEGLPLALTADEQNQMFPRTLDDFFGFEHEGHQLQLFLDMNPPFVEEILETRGDSVIMQTDDGIIAQRFLNHADGSSIPHYIQFPVATPQDWANLKTRYRADDPARAVNSAVVAAVRQAMAAHQAVVFGVCGFYGQMRNWMGVENLSLAFYDYPEMIHDMVALWSDLMVRQIDALPADVAIDQVHWWEDMACKNGPLVSPAVFREFIQPGYHRVMAAAHRRGCVLGMVDCDGNPHDLVPNWLEEGVNIMFPLEVAAGVDPYVWRREFGPQLLLRGGIGKAPLVQGGRAIDAELERVRPLLEQGGYIPHLDHLVPPDISYRNYCEYLEKKRKLIGR